MELGTVDGPLLPECIDNAARERGDAGIVSDHLRVPHCELVLIDLLLYDQELRVESGHDFFLFDDLLVEFWQLPAVVVQSLILEFVLDCETHPLCQ